MNNEANAPTIDIPSLRAAGWSDSRDNDGVVWLWPPHDRGEIVPEAMTAISRLGLTVEYDEEGAPVCRAA